MAGKWKHKSARNIERLYFASGACYCVDGEGVLSPDPHKDDEAMMVRAADWVCTEPTPVPKPAAKKSPDPKPEGEASTEKPPPKVAPKKTKTSKSSKKKKK